MNKTGWFTQDVIEKLEYYVYRLINPRNGETFYVGKGRGNRVFEHAEQVIGSTENEDTEKLRTIKSIHLEGLQCLHIIHRHGMDEATALEVEAALIDAYPSATNIVAGHGSNERGVAHAQTIQAAYAAPEIEFKHTAVLINVNQTALERFNLYDAVRAAWKIDKDRATACEFVMAVTDGLVRGVFIANEWKQASLENFPFLDMDYPKRWGFDGGPAPDGIRQIYVGHRIPAAMRKKGAANPIRYVEQPVP